MSLSKRLEDLARLLIVLSELGQRFSLELLEPLLDRRARSRGPPQSSTKARMIAMLAVIACLRRRTPESIATPRLVNT